MTEPYINAGVDIKYGVGFYTCSNAKYAFLMGITYSAQGLTSTRGQNAAKIQDSGDGSGSIGLPVRAVYHQSASESKEDDGTQDDGTIDLGDK